jgi:predicted phage-related endonuclease
MTSSRRTSEAASVVQINPARHTMTGKKAVGLTEEERQILLAELAEIAAELDELQARAKEITTRVHRAESPSPPCRRGVA